MTDSPSVERIAELRNCAAQTVSLLTLTPDVRRDLIAALDLALKWIEQGWQDIATAPKDGTRIILAWEGKAREGYWLDNSKSLQPWAGWKLVAMDPWPKGQPTHWLRLPSPPSASEGADKSGIADPKSDWGLREGAILQAPRKAGAGPHEDCKDPGCCPDNPKDVHKNPLHVLRLVSNYFEANGAGEGIWELVDAAIHYGSTPSPQPLDGDVGELVERLKEAADVADKPDMADIDTPFIIEVCQEAAEALKDSSLLYKNAASERDELRKYADKLEAERDRLREALEKIAMRDRMLGELQEPRAAQDARAALQGGG